MRVRSHVSRDMLQSAGLFKNERLAVWEYVSNGLQYVSPNTSPVVNVRIDNTKKSISIQDNGRGMDWSDLENFFIMHGDNIDRLEGRPGRGMFGTGKSAAFGIGDVLRVTSTKDNVTSSVELTRNDLEQINHIDDVPVKELIKNKVNIHPSGTIIEIEKIHLRNIDQSGVIDYIERQIAKWPKDVTVFVNNHKCEFHEPSIEREVMFKTEGEFENILGKINLNIKVSKSPLSSDVRGISIYSKGVWHETTSLGIDGKEMSEFIFGEIDVPALEDDRSIPSPFDVSRSMRLNPENKIVSAVYRFIAPLIEQVRKEIAEEHKKEKASEEAKRLGEVASNIAAIINSDFDSFRIKLKQAKAAMSSGGFDLGKNEDIGDLSEEGSFLFGGVEPAELVLDEGDLGVQSGGENPDVHNGETPRRLNPIVKSNTKGSTEGHPGGKGPKHRQSGGFQIEFKNMGDEFQRAEYEPSVRTIFINLDHPQITAAKQNRTIEDPIFRRLVNEVAFTEYSIALASELYNNHQYMDPYDPIYDIRDSINRVARRAANLYL